MKKLLFICFLFTPHLVAAKTLVIPPACVPYIPLIEKYEWNWQTAINVMFNESSCQPEIVNLNPSTETHKSKLYRDYPQGYCVGSFGLFQTSCIDQIYYDPALNIALAYQIYKVQGWSAWFTTCTTKVICKIQ